MYNWNYLSNIYNYKIYKENCIITRINNKSDKSIYSKEEIVKFCDCKVESFKKENIKIFVSKLRVEKKFAADEKIIDQECENNLKNKNFKKR